MAASVLGFGLKAKANKIIIQDKLDESADKSERTETRVVLNLILWSSVCLRKKV